MSFLKTPYCCTECKAFVPSLDKLYFVEDKSTKGFCSEDCIEDFFLPLVRYFENAEKSLRENINLESENIRGLLNDKELIENVLDTSHEVWLITNELDEDIYLNIKKIKDYYGIVLCKMFNGHPSFVLFSTATQSEIFLANMRSGERVYNTAETNIEKSENEESFTDDDAQFIQLLESKKSGLLAGLLETRKNSDIDFEHFSAYEDCFTETLEIPDEVFEFKDRDGDLIFNYIKSFMREKNNIFYIISCLKKENIEDESKVNAFPILAFPTTDLELCSQFRVGKKISGHISN
jgi:hypothetical protein